MNDNLSVVLAFARSRAREFRLITQIRRMCASSLARNTRFYFRWIPSELISGDFGSRRYDPFYDPSKTFVDRIGSKPAFEKQLHDQSWKSDPFVTTKISESEGSPRAAFLSGTGVDSKNKTENPIDEVVPAQPRKISRTAKVLQLLQEIERKNADKAGDDVEELDSSDSDRQRRLQKQRRTRPRILLGEMSEQGHLQGSNSYLELRSVSGTTRNKYRAASHNF